ncbi:hypothetical protein GCM10009544_11980 [Streptomyces stramineus]|uniref:Uncharacterized protein n=1 Tax=Streptomyces stramineus TaxID=173861 RepID=A0ABP3JE51_9ACTN
MGRGYACVPVILRTIGRRPGGGAGGGAGRTVNGTRSVGDAVTGPVGGGQRPWATPEANEVSQTGLE